MHFVEQWLFRSNTSVLKRIDSTKNTMNKIKSLFTVALLLFAFAAIAEENQCLKKMREQSKSSMPALQEIDYGKMPGKVDEKIPESQFIAGKFSVSPFASLRLVDSNEEFGAGLSAAYSITDRLTLEAEVVGEDFNDQDILESFRELGGNLKYYFPIGTGGFAPYLIGGYKRDLVIHENRLAAGAGLELRKNQFAVFADARVVHGFNQDIDELGNEVLIRLGGSYQF